MIANSGNPRRLNISKNTSRMNMTIVNHIHNTVITSVAKTAQSVFKRTLISFVMDNFLSPFLLSSSCFSSPRYVVQVEKSVARGRGGIYLWDPTPPGGVVRISGPPWTTCQRLFCSTRLLLQNTTQSAKRPAAAASAGQD